VSIGGSPELAHYIQHNHLMSVSGDDDCCFSLVNNVSKCLLLFSINIIIIIIIIIYYLFFRLNVTTLTSQTLV
jgi:hypothetical protein